MVATTPAKQEAKVDKRFKVIDVTLKRHNGNPEGLIEVLHKAQESFGYLEEEVLEYIARGLKLPLSQVYGVATFYHLFSLKPGGAHTCIVCMGTACYVKGAGKIIATLEENLGIKVGETSADGQVSLLSARCIGACGIAPAVVIDGNVLGKQDSESTWSKIVELKGE